MEDSNRRTFLSGVAGTTSIVFGTTGVARGASRDHFVISGGDSNRTVEYMLVVGDDIEKTDDSAGAPIDDDQIALDGDTIVEGGIVRGTVAGGGDAFRYSGEVVNFGVSVTAETADAVRVFRNGEGVALDRLGSHPAAETPVEFVDGRTAVVSGDWTTVRGHATTMYEDGVGTDYEPLGAATGETTTVTRESAEHPFALDSLELYDEENNFTAVHAAENPFAGPWNIESAGRTSGATAPESAAESEET